MINKVSIVNLKKFHKIPMNKVNHTIMNSLYCDFLKKFTTISVISQIIHNFFWYFRYSLFLYRIPPWIIKRFIHIEDSFELHGIIHIKLNHLSITTLTIHSTIKSIMYSIWHSTIFKNKQSWLCHESSFIWCFCLL